MKITDYAPRATDFDEHIKPGSIGIEVGCDVGAHAEAMLNYCNISKLYLVDIWQREFYFGYCKGRLYSKGFMNKIELIQGNSHAVSMKFEKDIFDFIYVDIGHDYDTVIESLNDWFPKLKAGGIFGYRNYKNNGSPLDLAVTAFANKYKLEIIQTREEAIITKCASWTLID